MTLYTDRDGYQQTEPARRVNLPEPAPLFPQMHDASNIEVTYVEFPGGPPHPSITGTLREILMAQNEPLLHISFLVDGRWRTTLVSLVALTQRGLPNDYEQLKAMFPDLRWSAS
jgi:hypothetical protein